MPGFEQASDDEIVSRLQTTMQREQQAYRALQQYQQIIPAASEYLSNRDSYQQWMQARNQPDIHMPDITVEAPHITVNVPTIQLKCGTSGNAVPTLLMKCGTSGLALPTLLMGCTAPPEPPSRA
jgi:hypothetical protein